MRGSIINIISLLVSQVFVKVFGLVYKLYLANKAGFGDVGNAIYNSGYQIYALLLTISSIGVPNAVAKIIAENKSDKKKTAEILKGALIVFSIVGVIGSLILFFASGFISNKLLNIIEAKKSIIALSPAIFNVCIISVFRGYYNGINKINITAKSQTVEQIFKTVFTIVLVEIAYVVSMSNTEIMAAFANFATTLATMLSLIYLYNKNDLKNVKANFKFKSAIKILCVSIPISLSSILSSLNRNIDSVTIVRYLRRFIGENNAKVQYGILSGKVDVIANVPISFIIAIATTIIPKISELKINNEYSKIKKITEQYIVTVILIMLPCIVYLMFFSDEILELLFKNASGNLLLRLSSISIIFIALEQVIHSVLQGIGKIFVPMMSLTLGIILKIFLNIKFLNVAPGESFFAGINGVCFATVCCHALACTISFIILEKNLKINFNFFKIILKPIIASCIMALCLYYAYNFLKRIIFKKVAIILASIFAGLTYIILIFSFKILSKTEVPIIKLWPNYKKVKKI